MLKTLSTIRARHSLTHSFTHLCDFFGDVVFHVVHGEEEALLRRDDVARVRVVRLVEKRIVRNEVVERAGKLRAMTEQLRVARRLIEDVMFEVIACRCSIHRISRQSPWENPIG